MQLVKSLELFTLIYIKFKEEAGHHINPMKKPGIVQTISRTSYLWWQLLFVLNVLSSSGRRKIARHAAQRNKERNDFQALFRIKFNSDMIAVV